MAHARHRLGHRLGKAATTIALPLQQVVGHPLRRFLADAGQHAQRIDQLLEQ